MGIDGTGVCVPLTRALLLTFVLASLVGAPALAQDATPDPITPIPVLTGGVGIVPSRADGQFTLENIVSPVVLIPIGEKLLVESRAAFEAPYTRQPDGSLGAKVEKEIDYLQLDYIANRYLTVTAGRFLTPFGIYNERLYPVWIRNFQSDPLTLPFAYGASNGAMLRGGFSVASNLNLNYAVYFSAQSSVRTLESDRSTGTRVGIFLPRQRLEIGGSFQHLLYESRSNRYGLHAEWQPRSRPLDVRIEFATGEQGRGYWIEPAYRLGGRLRHLQIMTRLQQFFVKPGNDGEDEGFPATNTHAIEWGVNYYLADGLRLTSSYGRKFTAAGNSDIWTMGITYRFALPLGRGGTR